MYPRLFLRMTDSIVNIIENKAIGNNSQELFSLRRTIKELREHKLYKVVGEREIQIGNELWEQFWKLPEDEIKKLILDEMRKQPPHYNVHGKKMTLSKDDIIVEKRELHNGSQEKNPVLQMRFLKKSDQVNLRNLCIEDLPKSMVVSDEDLPMTTPRAFVRRTIRVFCRSREKQELASHVYQQWREHAEQREANPNCAFMPAVQEEKKEEEDDDDDDHTESQPITQTQDETQDLHTQPDEADSQTDNPTPPPSTSRKRKGSDDKLSGEKKKLFN